MTTVQILTKARALVAARGGWTRGTLFNYGHSYCSIGAVQMAASGSPYHTTARTMKALNVLARANKIEVPIADWNDKASRKKREIVAAFDKAIKAEKQKARK